MIDLKRILVPTDFSKFSQVALDYAAALAERFAAEIHLLHVVQDLAVFLPEAVAAAPPVVAPVEQFTAAARTALERVVKELHTEYPILAYKLEIVRRQANLKTLDFALNQFASRTGLPNARNLAVILGQSESLGAGLIHILLGSVTERVVRKAPCPVLTVRHPEHEFVHP